MKTSIITLGTIIALFATSSVFTSCGGENATESDSTEQHDVDKHTHDEMASATFACPMHPEEMGGEGDKCSKCGMALVLNESTDQEDGEHTHED